MDELKRYKIVYTEAAEEDIFSKAEYIEKAYHDSNLAFKWYTRLRTQIQKNLSFLPYKYQSYDVGVWAGQGIREYVLRNDIVLFSVDERSTSVLIHASFTRGKNIAEDIWEEKPLLLSPSENRVFPAGEKRNKNEQACRPRNTDGMPVFRIPV